MTVHMAARTFLAVVQMDRTQVAEPDDAFKLLHRKLVAHLRAQVIACSQGMARVDADAHTTLVLYPLDDAGYMLKAPTQVSPLPGGVLNHRRHTLGLGQGSVNLTGYLVQALLLTHTVQMAARMEVQHRQSQLLGASHLVQESGTALCQCLLVRRAEVDQVTVVRQHIAGFKATLREQLFERLHILRGQGFAHPTALVAGEKGKSLGSDGLGIQDGVTHASACAHMRSDIFTHNLVQLFYS